jgi:hypothetical protein
VANFTGETYGRTVQEKNYRIRLFSMVMELPAPTLMWMGPVTNLAVAEQIDEIAPGNRGGELFWKRPAV